MNPDNVKYKKFSLPKYHSSTEMKCDSCKRNSTLSTDIEISNFKASPMQQLIGKEYGSLTRNRLYSAEETHQFKFCYFCN